MSEKLPAMQWYPGDWRKDPGIQSLDYEARGIWRECLDFMHESPQRGWLVFPNGSAMCDADIAQMLGIPEATWKQTRSKLEARNICAVGESGAVGNRRMLRDEATRQARIEAGRKGGEKSKPPTTKKQTGSKPEAKGEANGGSSVSSSVSSSTITTLSFDDFWVTYPKRRGSNPKSPARKKWDTAIRNGATPEGIMEGVKQFRYFCDAEKKTGTEFVPMATTWLNQKRWEDEVEVTEADNGGSNHHIDLTKWSPEP